MDPGQRHGEVRRGDRSALPGRGPRHQEQVVILVQCPGRGAGQLAELLSCR